MRREVIVVVAMLASCDRGAPASHPLAAAPHYRVSLAPCAAQPCEPTLVLTALAGFKVNEDYPTKWVPDGASVEAAPGPGTFTHASKTVGELKLPVRAGTTRVAGAFKFSVCTDDECKIESPTIAFDLP